MAKLVRDVGVDTEQNPRWRRTMEVSTQILTNILTGIQDEHVTLVQFHDNMAFFAVYDGHGGKEASRVSAERLHVVRSQAGACACLI